MDPFTLIALVVGALVVATAKPRAASGGSGGSDPDAPGNGAGGGGPPPSPSSPSVDLGEIGRHFRRWKSALEAKKRAESLATQAFLNPFNPGAEDEAAEQLKAARTLAYEQTLTAGPSNPVLVDEKTVRQWLFEDTSWQLWSMFGLSDVAQTTVDQDQFVVAFSKSVSKLQTNPPWNALQTATFWIQQTAKVVSVFVKGG